MAVYSSRLSDEHTYALMDLCPSIVIRMWACPFDLMNIQTYGLMELYKSVLLYVWTAGIYRIGITERIWLIGGSRVGD
jgi:hypothetical protein